MSNIIVATFVDGCTTAVTEAIYEGDYGMILQFEGLDLPDVYTVNFGNEAVSPLAHSMIGNADGVEIPNQLLTESGHVMAWVFLHTGEDDGETEYAVTIPVLEKMDTQIDDPTPEQESALNQAIAALNAGVERAETAADSAEQIAADLGDFETAMEAVNAAKDAAEQSATNASGSASAAAASQASAGQSANAASISAAVARNAETHTSQDVAAAARLVSAAEQSATNAAASEAAARAVEESIPADYTALSEDVEVLKDDVDDLEVYVRELSPAVTVGPSAVVSVSDAAVLDADSIVIDIVSAQPGSGDPSPDNVRPIAGWTGANIYHGTNQQDYDTLSVVFPAAAGAVYGGTLDLTAGKLTVDTKAVTLTGTENIQTSTTNRFYVTYNDAIQVNTANQLTEQSVISDRFKPVTWATLGSVDGNLCCAPVYGRGIAFRDDSITTANAWKAYFAENPTRFVYRLGTPVVYDIDPVTLTMLRGANVLWADCGETTLTYRQDVATLLEESEGGGGGVTDVQVNGVSVVQDGVANVPLASPTVPGVVVSGTITVTGTTPSITALPGIRYICGEVSTLDITLPASGIVDVVFESGSTPAVLTVTPPTGVTMKWANGFDPTALEANTVYEINIMDGEYGVVGTWI